MKPLPFIALLVIAPLLAHAASNSKGKDSPVVVGTLVSVSADGKTFVVKQDGDAERTLILSGKAKPEYVGIADAKERQPTPGYGVKAKVGAGEAIQSIRLTQPLTPSKPLPASRLTMSEAQVFAAADANKDGKLSYVEMSASIYRSEKHGPDKFAGTDKNDDGALSVAEFTTMLPDVNWWKFSRQPAAEFFKTSDTDRDGRLSTVEFTPLASGKNHVEAVFKRADKNRDGSLDAAETTAYLKGITEDSGSEPE